VFAKASFKKIANEFFFLVKADFPKRKKNKLSQLQIAKNNKLVDLYNKNRFFTTIVLIDPFGKVKGTIRYVWKYKVADYIRILTNFNSL